MRRRRAANLLEFAMVLPDDPPGTCTPCTEEARLRARVFLVDADIPFRATDRVPRGTLPG